MPRGKTISIDEKIARAQEKVDKIQEKLLAAKKEVQLLMDKKDEEAADRLYETMINSGKSYEEIMEFLKG